MKQAWINISRDGMISVRNGISCINGMISDRNGIIYIGDEMISSRDGMISDKRNVI